MKPFYQVLETLREKSSNRQRGYAEGKCLVDQVDVTELLFHFDRLDEQVREPSFIEAAFLNQEKSDILNKWKHEYNRARNWKRISWLAIIAVVLIGIFK